MSHLRRPLATLLVLAATAGSAAAEPLAGQALSVPGFKPRVPVSAFARPLAWFDRSRLNLSSSISVGSGFGRGTEALQITRLSYQFGAPLSMSLSVGNSLGIGSARSGNAFFLEGLDVAYRPHPSMLFQIHYRDLRSPLQLSSFDRIGPWAP